MKKTKISPALLIILGLTLIAASIVGAIIFNPTIPEESENSRYRFLEQNQPVEVTNAVPTPRLSEIPPENPIVAPHGMLTPGKTFIHVPSHPEYERPKIPDKISIPVIGLTAPLIVSDYIEKKVEGETFGQWVAPSKFAAGWHPDSALLEQTGKIVSNGHHNEFGEVFGDLVDLELGDMIIVYFEGDSFTYVVSNRLILPERFQETAVRLENARWLGKTNDTRVTLVTCWPAD